MQQSGMQRQSRSRAEIACQGIHQGDPRVGACLHRFGSCLARGGMRGKYNRRLRRVPRESRFCFSARGLAVYKTIRGPPFAPGKLGT